MNIRNTHDYRQFASSEAPKEIKGFGARCVRKLKSLAAPWLFFYKQTKEYACLYRGEYKKDSEDAEFERMYYDQWDTLENAKRGIICPFDGRVYHGGPTDRLRGILSVYKEAKRRGIPFYIKWTHPFNLEDYLEPAGYDWRIDDKEISYSRKQTMPVIIQDMNDFYSKMKLRAALHHATVQWHVYSNSDDARGEYRTLFHELFRPSEKVRIETERHLKELGENYAAYTFRFLRLLGDFEDWSYHVLPENEALELMEKVRNEMMKLANDIPGDWKILVTSDSKRFLDFIKDADPRIYIVPGDVKNIDLLDGKYDGAWLKTFVDQQLLMQARHVTLMRTGEMFKSGFPRFAAEVGGVGFTDYDF